MSKDKMHPKGNHAYSVAFCEQMTRWADLNYEGDRALEQDTQKCFESSLKIFNTHLNKILCNVQVTPLEQGD